jgi:hypothetical protein
MVSEEKKDVEEVGFACLIVYGLRKTMRTLSEDSKFPSRDSK